MASISCSLADLFIQTVRVFCTNSTHHIYRYVYSKCVRIAKLSLWPALVLHPELFISAAWLTLWSCKTKQFGFKSQYNVRHFLICNLSRSQLQAGKTLLQIMAAALIYGTSRSSYFIIIIYLLLLLFGRNNLSWSRLKTGSAVLSCGSQACWLKRNLWRGLLFFKKSMYRRIFLIFNLLNDCIVNLPEMKITVVFLITIQLQTAR